jgi:hypothetical protein
MGSFDKTPRQGSCRFAQDDAMGYKMQNIFLKKQEIQIKIKICIFFAIDICGKI